MTKKHFNIRISGKVQGVYFRGSAKAKAVELGITGIVRNESNGDVYAEIEGTPAQLSAFIQWCHKGPPTAQVVAVQQEEGPLSAYTNFSIQR
ncbi:MAG: acylphosphatase [Saprospiraceae bacterium]